MAAQLYAEAEEADRVVGIVTDPREAPGCVPAVRQPTGGAGDRTDQPDPAGMGELLCGGTCEPVLLVYQRLGRKEDSAASDACAEAQGFRLAAVE